VEEKNLILKKVRRNSKIEADLNLLNLKNIEEIDLTSFFSFFFSNFSFNDNFGFFIALESLKDLPLYLFDIF
tara:strand:+ start:255 stop:470 length:216 start_codon:yes stop_codon:yes gene_type:complete